MNWKALGKTVLLLSAIIGSILGLMWGLDWAGNRYGPIVMFGVFMGGFLLFLVFAVGVGIYNGFAHPEQEDDTT